MEFYHFPYIGNFILPTDEFICFRGVGIPPSRIYIYGIECGDNRDILLTNNICYLGVSESGVCNEPAREWASSWGVIIRSCADI